MTAPAASAIVAERLEAEDLARARWYSFFSRWFLAPPDRQAVDHFIAGAGADGARRGGEVRDAGPADSSSGLESAWKEFVDALAGRSLAESKSAYDDTFISVGEAPVSLHASVYLTGFSNERPLAELRQWLAAEGIQSVESGLLTEDHLGLLCEAMAWLIIGQGDDVAGSRTASALDRDAAQQHLFLHFIAPVCDELCRRLAEAPDAGAYRELGRLFAAFCAVERQAFDIES